MTDWHAPTLRDLAAAAATLYGYDDDDKAIIRKLAQEDRPGLLLALQNDPVLQQRMIWGW